MDSLLLRSIDVYLCLHLCRMNVHDLWGGIVLCGMVLASASEVGAGVLGGLSICY